MPNSLELTTDLSLRTAKAIESGFEILWNLNRRYHVEEGRLVYSSPAFFQQLVDWAEEPIPTPVAICSKMCPLLTLCTDQKERAIIKQLRNTEDFEQRLEIVSQCKVCIYCEHGTASLTAMELYDQDPVQVMALLRAAGLEKDIARTIKKFYRHLYREKTKELGDRRFPWALVSLFEWQSNGNQFPDLAELTGIGAYFELPEHWIELVPAFAEFQAALNSLLNG